MTFEVAGLASDEPHVARFALNLYNVPPIWRFTALTPNLYALNG